MGILRSLTCCIAPCRVLCSPDRRCHITEEKNLSLSYTTQGLDNSTVNSPYSTSRTPPSTPVLSRNLYKHLKNKATTLSRNIKALNNQRFSFACRGPEYNLAENNAGALPDVISVSEVSSSATSIFAKVSTKRRINDDTIALQQIDIGWKQDSIQDSTLSDQSFPPAPPPTPVLSTTRENAEIVSVEISSRLDESCFNYQEKNANDTLEAIQRIRLESGTTMSHNKGGAPVLKGGIFKANRRIEQICKVSMIGQDIYAEVLLSGWNNEDIGLHEIAAVNWATLVKDQGSYIRRLIGSDAYDNVERLNQNLSHRTEMPSEMIIFVGDFAPVCGEDISRAEIYQHVERIDECFV